MKKALLLSALLMTGLAVASMPAASALACTQHVDADVDYTVAPNDVSVSADASANPAGLVECARQHVVIHP